LPQRFKRKAIRQDFSQTKREKLAAPAKAKRLDARAFRLKNFGQVSRLISILDFRFWILDCSLRKTIQNPKSKIQNRFHCGATVQDFHPLSLFTPLFEKATREVF